MAFVVTAGSACTWKKRKRTEAIQVPIPELNLQVEGMRELVTGTERAAL